MAGDIKNAKKTQCGVNSNAPQIISAVRKTPLKKGVQCRIDVNKIPEEIINTRSCWSGHDCLVANGNRSNHIFIRTIIEPVYSPIKTLKGVVCSLC